MCVCVFLRERESERERAVCNIRWYDCMSIVEGVSMYVCECLCVCRRERERERKREQERASSVECKVVLRDMS